jgi:hypothetical protein
LALQREELIRPYNVDDQLSRRYFDLDHGM